MTQIIEKFDFDDRPGLEKLGNLQDSMDRFANSIDELKELMAGAAEGVGEAFQDIDKKVDDTGKKVGRTAGLYAELARQAVLFFKKAGKAAVDFANENDRIADGSEKIGKKADEARKVLSDKLAPIVFVIQQTVSKLLDKVIKGGGDINNSVIVKIAAGISGIRAAVGQAFRNLGASIKISVNEFKILGKTIQSVFTRGDRKDTIKSEIEALRKENENLQKSVKFVGDAYTEAYDSAKKSIGDLVNSGYFNLKKADAEALERIKKLRDAYAQLASEVNNQLEASRINAAEGLKRINLEEQAALREVELLREKAKEAANAAGLQFDLDDEINEIRKNLEIDFQKQRKEIIDKTNADIAKESRELFKKAFGVYFEDLDELGKKANAKREKDDLALIRKQSENLKKEVDRINKEEAGKEEPGVFDAFKSKLFDSLNLSQEEGDFILQNVGKALQGVEDLFTAGINARIADNDRLIQSIRERKGVVQAELDEELRLQKEGRENNVRTKQEELQRLQREEEAAQKEREKLEKKARAAQVVSDSIQQTSSLITTAANIFKGFANIPIVGLALGAAAVAGLFILFNSIKAKAAAASKPQDRLYKGGSMKGKVKRDSGYVNWLNGRSDEPGRGDGHRVEGSNLVIGGREMVVAERPANAQSDDFWNNMNSGKYNDIDLATTLDDAATNQKRINSRFQKRQTKIIALQQKQTKAQYITEEQLRAALEAQTNSVLKYLDNRPHYIAESEDTTKIRKITAKEEKTIILSKS